MEVKMRKKTVTESCVLEYLSFSVHVILFHTVIPEVWEGIFLLHMEWN